MQFGQLLASGAVPERPVATDFWPGPGGAPSYGVFRFSVNAM